MRGEVGVNVDNWVAGSRWPGGDKWVVGRDIRPLPPLHVGEGADPRRTQRLWESAHHTYICGDTDLPALPTERPDITAKRPTRLMGAPAPAFTLAPSNRFPASTPARCFRGPVPRVAGSSRKRFMISPQSRLDWRGWRRVSHFRQPRFFCPPYGTRQGPSPVGAGEERHIDLRF